MTSIYLLSDLTDEVGAALTRQIKESPGPLDLYVNSAGGSWPAGQSLGSAVAAHGQVTARGSGIVGSASTLPLIAAKRSYLAKGSLFFVHFASMLGVGGNADQLDRASAALRVVDTSLVATYVQKTRQPEHVIRELLGAETLMSAEEAWRLGFIDGVDSEAIAAKLDINTLPDRIRAKVRAKMSETPNITDAGQPPAIAASAAPQATDLAAIRAEERARISGLYGSASSLGIENSFVDGLLNGGMDDSHVREQLIREHAQRAAAMAPAGSMIPWGASSIAYGRANADTGMLEEALTARLGGKAVSGNPWASRRLSDIGRELHRIQGRNVWSMSDESVLTFRASNGALRFSNDGAMHTTSDFPQLLGSSAYKTLMASYELARSPLVQLARRKDHVNFQPTNAVRLGSAPKLEQVLESGEITRGTIAETGESWQVKTYARIFSISRQALVNDDLSAFSNIVGMMGQSAAQLEADLLFALFTPNSGDGVTMADLNPWFDTLHGNISSGGAVIASASIAAGYLAMRQQTTVGGNFYLNSVPRFMLTGPKQELVARQVLTPINPVVISTTDNPFANDLLLLVEPRFGAANTSWFLFSDPNAVPCIEYGSLPGGAPQILMNEHFETDGASFRVRHDFGCGVTDWRGAYRNSGA